MSTQFDLGGGLDEFDLDSIDIDMLDDFLDDELDTAPAQAPAKKARFALQASTKPAQQHQRSPPKKPQYTHGAKHNQLTIDSLFGRNGSATTTYQRGPPPKRPASAIDSGTSAADLRQPPAKAMRLGEPQTKWSAETIDIDSDYGDLMEDLVVDDLLDE
ncbi:hypothetical protein GGI10_003363, partial [Coemansia sp. RSA 2530]